MDELNTPPEIKKTAPLGGTKPLQMAPGMAAAPPQAPASTAPMPPPLPTNGSTTFSPQSQNKFQFTPFFDQRATKPKGMPSILDDEQQEVERPFSGKAQKGIPDDFDEIHANWMKHRTPEYNTQILEAVQPIIDTAIQSYVGPNANQTIRTQAKLMALRALETYDPTKGNVRNHLLSQLQSLRRYAAKQQNIIDIPEQVGLDYQALQEATNELRDTLGREPTDDELADHTGMSKRRIKKIRSFNQPVSEGATHNETDENSSGGDTASNIPGQDPGAEAWLDFVYDDLSDTDKLIMDMMLGRNGRKKASVKEIAEALNISPSAVSQRAAKIQEMLDRRHEYDVL